MNLTLSKVCSNRYCLTLVSNYLKMKNKLFYSNLRFSIILLLSVILFSSGSKAETELKPHLLINNNPDYIKASYAKVDFCNANKLDPKVFQYALTGYLNLKQSGKLNQEKDILTICDYSLSANIPRMWIIDMSNYKVLLNTYIAHGQGTGEEFAFAFSNKENSHQSSLGFYVTGTPYIGQHGLSLYLHGVDQGYNNAAYQRSIVLHGASYVSEGFIQKNKRLGRSWGCPAVDEKLSAPIIDLTKEGTCLFVYYPDSNYLTSSNWLNNKAIDENLQ